MLLQWLNFVASFVYLVAFLVDIFTLHGVTTIYSQAFLIGYGLTSFRNNVNPVIPLWVASLVNSMVLVMDRTLWVTSVVVVVEWVQFTIVLTNFLVTSKNRILDDGTIDRFPLKLELLVLFLFDLFIDKSTLGLLLYVVLRVQRSVYPLDVVMLLATVIYTGVIGDYQNLALGVVLFVYENIQYNRPRFRLR